MERECKLAFHLDERNAANVEIDGSFSDVLFCLVGLTAQVCNELNIPPRLFAAMLPELIKEQERQLQQKTRVDMDAISKMMGGGNR